MFIIFFLYLLDYLSDPDYLDKQITSKALNNSIYFADDILNRYHRLETNIASADVQVKKGTPSHGHFMDSTPEKVALKQGKDALVSVKATLHLWGSYCVR